MKTKTECLFGVNWRSTLSGIGAAFMAFLTWLAALPFNIGNVNGIDLGALIPPAWKAKVCFVSAIAALILGCIKALCSKDRQVEGNPSTGFTVGKKDEPPREIPPPTSAPAESPPKS